MEVINTIKHLVADRDKEPLGKKRSPHWPAVRKKHLEQFPNCAVCGGTEKVEVHHQIPFHIDQSLELREVER
jgi:5-methylcytosine-specific restriction endonuclease McrA